MSSLLRDTFSVMWLAIACACTQTPAGGVPEAPAPPSPQADAGASAVATHEPTEPEAPAIQTLFVRDRLAECQSEGERQCLQVRNADTEPWRNLYAPIEGFEYEASNSYELRVAVESIPNPPADGVSLRYRLIEVVSRRKAPPAAPAD